MPKRRHSPDNHIVELLKAKRLSDPSGFARYLPELSQALDAADKAVQSKRSPFGLTPREREARVADLRGLLAKEGERNMTAEEARAALEACAVLIRDGTLPDDVDRRTLEGLVREAVGKSPSAARAEVTHVLRQDQADKVAEHLSVLRGVTLHLTWDFRLVSVTYSPAKMRERRRALAFVGSAADSEPDVAARHDEYLDRGGL
jgi:hypothetical protein